MRVVLVSGLPPLSCGVADYTVRLGRALSGLGLEVELVDSPRWGLEALPGLWSIVKAKQPQIVHIQYPSAGYGAGLALHGLGVVARLASKTVVTLHEFSQSRLVRRLAVLPLAVFADRVVCTNKYEGQNLKRWLPILKTPAVIPIGSNIPFLQSDSRRIGQVVHFGLIRPNRGLEDFIELARLSSQSSRQFQFVVLGSPQAGQELYFDQQKAQANQLSNLIWQTGLSDLEAAQVLSESEFAYLPFTDGASERRGSLLAALGNGAVVLTTHGSQTPKNLEGRVCFVQNPQEALAQLVHLTHNPQQKEVFRQAGRVWVQAFDWGHIARTHLELYQQVQTR